MVKKKVVKVVLPSAWASAIVNHDYSGLNQDDISALNNCLLRHGLSFAVCVDCVEAGFRKSHDAWQEMPLAANCETYTFWK